MGGKIEEGKDIVKVSKKEIMEMEKNDMVIRVIEECVEGREMSEGIEIKIEGNIDVINDRRKNKEKEWIWRLGRLREIIGIDVIKGNMERIKKGVEMRKGKIEGEKGKELIVENLKIVGIDIEGIIDVGKIEEGKGKIKGMMRKGRERRRKGGKRKKRK